MMVAWCSVGDGGDSDDVEVKVRMWRLLAGYRGRRAADGRNSSGDDAGKTRKERQSLVSALFDDKYQARLMDKSTDTSSFPLHIRSRSRRSPSTSSINYDTHEASYVVLHLTNNFLPISLQESDEFNQEDSADLDGNTQFVPYDSLNHEEIKSSTTNLELSNLDESMQDELNQFERLLSLGIGFPSTRRIRTVIVSMALEDKCDAGWKARELEFNETRLYCDVTEKLEYVSLSECLCSSDMDAYYNCLNYGFKYNLDSDVFVIPECHCYFMTSSPTFLDNHIDIRYHLIKETLIIMSQQQHAADVHPDELCPPNKRYDLRDVNKKVDLEHVQCPSESKILMNIIKNHPLRFSIAASASVPWIYMAQFWHTLKEDGSKHRLKFLLDRKELTLTLDDFRTIFHLPQANDNNHASFVPPPSFSDMVPFYKQVLGFTMELKTVSNFKIPGLLQPWQTLCKIFSKCLTTRVTGWDQPPLQIMQMLYCFVNNIHVDYAELMKKQEQGWDADTNMDDHRRDEARSIIRLPTAEKVDEMILQDMIQVSLAEHKSREEQEARENVALVYEHLAAQEIEKLVEESENVDDGSPPRHDDTFIPGTRLEPRRDKESPEVEIVQEKEEETTKDTEVETDKETPIVDVTNIVIGMDIKEIDKRKDKTGRNQAREWNERKNTSSTVLSDFIGRARNPFKWFSLHLRLMNEELRMEAAKDGTRVEHPEVG
ncbi:hypothetical protein Tco_0577873 [Tanacetum coccineum]